MRYQHEEEDWRRAKDRQLHAAVEQYRKEREELAKDLGLKGQEIDRAIREWGKLAAIATYDSAIQVGEAAKRGIEAVGRGIMYMAQQQIAWGGQRGRGTQRRAKGGIDLVNQPTRYLAGEAGPEIAAFIPLRHQMTHDVRFSHLPVDLNGQGMGQMSPQRVKQIAWRVVDQVADELRGY